MPYFEGFTPGRVDEIEIEVRKQGGLLLDQGLSQGRQIQIDWERHLEDARFCLASFKCPQTKDDRIRILKGISRGFLYLVEKVDFQTLYSLFIETFEESLSDQIPEGVNITLTQTGHRFSIPRRPRTLLAITPQDAVIVMRHLGFSGKPETLVSLSKEYGISPRLAGDCISKVCTVVYRKAAKSQAHF